MRTDPSVGARDVIEAISGGLGHQTIVSAPAGESAQAGAGGRSPRGAGGRSAGEAAHARHALRVAGVADAAKPTHEQRVVLQRLLRVDEAAEQLVVASR